MSSSVQSSSSSSLKRRRPPPSSSSQPPAASQSPNNNNHATPTNKPSTIRSNLLSKSNDQRPQQRRTVTFQERSTPPRSRQRRNQQQQRQETNQKEPEDGKTSDNGRSTEHRVPQQQSRRIRPPSTWQQQQQPLSRALLWKSIQISLGFSVVGWIISMVTKSHVHLDLVGVGAIFTSLAPSWKKAARNRRILISGLAIVLWSIRLMTFLGYRAMIMRPHDERLTNTLASAGGTTLFWTASALWGIGTALPHFLGAMQPHQNGNRICSVVGVTLCGIGLGVETVADLQKWFWKYHLPQTSVTPSFCQVGLWKLCQHPNWFGDIVFWMGIWILNGPAYVVAGSPTRSLFRLGAATCLGPLLVTLLLYGQATGHISNAVAQAKERYGYGIDPAYTHYVDTTPLLVPHFEFWFGPRP